MPLSFFSIELGMPNFLRLMAEVYVAPLFLTQVLGAPNYGFALSLAANTCQLPYGSPRWTSSVPNGSSFPPVASGARGPLVFHRICTAAVPRHSRRGHAS